MSASMCGEARERDIPVKTFTIPMHDVDRAIADGEEVGFVKIHVKEGTDRILGATIVARHAGEMINEITLAMVAGIGLRTLARVIHAYPTQAEAIKKAADAYTRTRSPCAGATAGNCGAALAAPKIINADARDPCRDALPSRSTAGKIGVLLPTMSQLPSLV